MRVLFVAARFFPDIGGVEKHVAAISQLLAQEGYDVTVITSTNKSHIKNFEVINGIKVIRKFLRTKNQMGLFNNIENLFRMVMFMASNWRLIMRQDVVHLHDVSSFLWIVPLHFLIRTKVYITFHGFERDPIKKSDIFLRRIAERSSRGNICVGSFLEKWYGTKADVTILGGIDKPRECNIEGSQSAVYIGRLAEDTSVMKYIESIRILKDRFGIILPLHICGDGPLLGSLTDFAKKNKIEIELHGFVADTHDYICQSKYVFASGFLAILETMSYKRGVFSIYETQLKKDYFDSIADVSSMLHVQDSPDKLAVELYDTILNPAGSKLRLEKAYAFALSNSWKRISEIYLKLWKKHAK